ncbi:hypothetical protein SAMN04489712_106199 [Thermomonospora echinospora]|uniref:DUF5753 domain-containing protein n=1 Tax=Thermomonospora echinospora TaxID=1992 RepID=A0A1H6B2D1_9ACTN|nr:helix-turn-helix transcriptional regulator [Thermomonospora echinospora]SEG55043.1 hypothetical protein SAMN04489712_106199 [Thermomonospora echinospora]
MTNVREPLDPKISMWHFLAFYLRFMREKHGLSLAQCGKIVHAARSTVCNIEAGRLRPHDHQMRLLDLNYGTGILFQMLLWFAQMAHDPNWGRQHYLYEVQANTIKIYNAHAVPRPFQTERYIRAIVEAGSTIDVEAEVAKRIAQQQAILDRETPQFYWILLDESVLACRMEDPEIMKEQLRHLRVTADLPNVILRFVPPSAGPHPGYDGPLQILSLEGRDVAYAGAQNSGRLIEEPVEVRETINNFDRIGAKALPEGATRSLIDQYLEGYT